MGFGFFLMGLWSILVGFGDAEWDLPFPQWRSGLFFYGVWGLLNGIWVHFNGILGVSRSHLAGLFLLWDLGGSWGGLGAFLRQIWGIWGQIWVVLGSIWGI